MKIEKKELNEHQVEITVHVTKIEANPWLITAATRLSQTKNIKGFRPGKAPYEILKKEFGEEKILTEAMEDIINNTLGKILDDEKLNTYGNIDFDILPTLNSDDAAVYKATITLMPTVTLGGWKNKKIKKQNPIISDEELNKALDELATMSAPEELVTRPASMGDKITCNLEVFVDGTLIEGGKATDFAVVLGEGRMIPGFEEKLVGIKPDEKTEFTLPFPKNYHAANLSEKPATFKIYVKQIFTRNKPVIDDTFAKRVGLKDLSQLKESLQKNLLKEKTDFEENKVEIEALKHITDSSKFSPLPQKMIDSTTAELAHEFEHKLSHQGIKVEDYLKSIGKTIDQVKKDFEPKAIERIKTSLALGKLAEDEKITLTQEEIETELKKQIDAAKNHPEALDDLNHPEYRRHLANMIINQKLIQFIKSQIVE